jgi:Adenylate and Guanylate cyclase catalytic domain
MPSIPTSTISEVIVRAIGNDLHMDYSATGQTTHLAARMEQLATPGIILLTAETLRLAEGFVQVNALGPIPVKGLTEPVEVFELVGVRQSAAVCRPPPREASPALSGGRRNWRRSRRRWSGPRRSGPASAGAGPAGQCV